MSAIRVLLQALLLAKIIFQYSFAQTPWPPVIYQGYFNQCKYSLTSQKVPDLKADGICYCLSSAFSKEFGMEEYDYMRRAQPNPNGSSIDKRLYKVIKQCTN
jgi:hypothetical protein